MRTPIYAYLIVISCMIVCAASAVAAGGPVTILLGGVGFAVSDLAVARNQFIEDDFRNRVWGLPLYFGSQLVLASTVAT